MSSTELMQRYCDGDCDAFPALYDATAPRLLRYLRSLLRDDAAAAEDVLQQTFLKLHGARSVYAAGTEPMAWLYAIAHRTCIDEMRRRRRSRVRLLPRGDETLPEVEASFCGTCTSAEATELYSAEERSAALRALDELPTDQRTALALTKIQGLTMGQAAQTLGTTEGAVKLRAHRAYVRLRELLGRDELFDERSVRLRGGTSSSSLPLGRESARRSNPPSRRNAIEPTA